MPVIPNKAYVAVSVTASPHQVLLDVASWLDIEASFHWNERAYEAARTLRRTASSLRDIAGNRKSPADAFDWPKQAVRAARAGKVV